MKTPRFAVLANNSWPLIDQGVFSLVIDNWDDFTFKTSYTLYYGTGQETKEIGTVKIAKVGMAEHEGHTKTPLIFERLTPDFYSLGQDREYYENLMALPNGRGMLALRALQDVAYSKEQFTKVQNEDAFNISLLRALPLKTITAQFRRIAHGHSALTDYNFTYECPVLHAPSAPLNLGFEVRVESYPPTNVHILIGANGVGKSSLLRDFVRAASCSREASGWFKNEYGARFDIKSMPFANIVYVAFSAFDQLSSTTVEPPSRVKIHAVGLTTADDNTLEEQFVQSLEICARSRRKKRWIKAVETLSRADSILNEAELAKSIDRYLGFDLKALEEKFSRLSSGHKIALLTVTRLVEFTEEGSLVLLDEPETHLHPPLLSALIRTISDLLIDRNGVAIIATHSPVVLQEVPASCVWTLRRSGQTLKASAPANETFGESVSRITADTFSLDVNQTGYVQVLRELLEMNDGSAAQVLDQLHGELGSEGRLILSSLGSNWRRWFV